MLGIINRFFNKDKVVIHKPITGIYGNPIDRNFVTITLDSINNDVKAVIDKSTPIYSKQFDLRCLTRLDTIEIDNEILVSVVDLLKYRHDVNNPIFMTHKKLTYRVSVSWDLNPIEPVLDEQTVTVVYRNDLCNTNLDMFIGYYCYNARKSIGLLVNDYNLTEVRHKCECGQELVFSSDNKLMNHHHVAQAPYLQKNI